MKRIAQIYIALAATILTYMSLVLLTGTGKINPAGVYRYEWKHTFDKADNIPAANPCKKSQFFQIKPHFIDQ